MALALPLADGASVLEELHREVLQHLLPELQREVTPGGRQFTDCCDYLTHCFHTPASQQAFAAGLKDLEAKRVASLRGQHIHAVGDPIDTVPAPPAQDDTHRFQVGLWQLGFVEGASIQGTAVQS